jgi:hypothetical protein
MIGQILWTLKLQVRQGYILTKQMQRIKIQADVFPKYQRGPNSK